MDPEDRDLLLRVAKLAEDNNRMIRSVKRSIFWTRVWDLFKIALIVIPLIIGYAFLQPYLGSLGGSLNQAKQLLNSYQQ